MATIFVNLHRKANLLMPGGKVRVRPGAAIPEKFLPILGEEWLARAVAKGALRAIPVDDDDEFAPEQTAPEQTAPTDEGLKAALETGDGVGSAPRAPKPHTTIVGRFTHDPAELIAGVERGDLNLETLRVLIGNIEPNLVDLAASIEDAIAILSSERETVDLAADNPVETAAPIVTGDILVKDDDGSGEQVTRG